ncbi:SAP domain-containing protein [Wolffia australiana]
MPTGYSILDNRPLDHWKVSELKEELRRRKMTTKGLKEDLIKRLDEAVRNERALGKDQEIAGDPESQTHPQDINSDVHEPQSTETTGLEEGADDIKIDEHLSYKKPEQHGFMVDINAAVEDTGIEIPAEEPTEAINLEETAEEKTDSGTQMTDGNIVDQEKDTDQKYDASCMNSEPGVVEPENQESEVSPAVDVEVKSVSISTDSVSLSEKFDLKDDLNATNVHLEEEPVKREVADSQLLDINVEPDDSKLPLGEEDDDNAKKIDVSGVGSPEKLNLDRSSGDESMDEDVLETKQAEPNDNSIEEGGLKGVRDLHVVKEEVSVNVEEGGFSPEKKDVVHEGEISASVDKRKAEEQGSGGTAEPVKRQRRWNSESINIPEKVVRPTTPKEVSVVQTAPRLDAVSPKERIVSPSQKTPTTSLRIDHFVRPFTLKAVQELLGKTGTVSSFWMDHIKTHCFVTYATVEEAEATRNAVYNLQWPPNGGRLLVADFVDPHEVKAHVEGPPQTSIPAVAPTPVTAQSERSPAGPVASRPPPPHAPAVVTGVREKPQLLPPPPPPPPPANVAELPVLTLDDLFKKTNAVPRIYYLPLTDEQVNAKSAMAQR